MRTNIHQHLFHSALSLKEQRLMRDSDQLDQVDLKDKVISASTENDKDITIPNNASDLLTTTLQFIQRIAILFGNKDVEKQVGDFLKNKNVVTPLISKQAIELKNAIESQSIIHTSDSINFPSIADRVQDHKDLAYTIKEASKENGGMSIAVEKKDEVNSDTFYSQVKTLAEVLRGKDDIIRINYEGDVVKISITKEVPKVVSAEPKVQDVISSPDGSAEDWQNYSQNPLNPDNPIAQKDTVNKKRNSIAFTVQKMKGHTGNSENFYLQKNSIFTEKEYKKQIKDLISEMKAKGWSVITRTLPSGAIYLNLDKNPKQNYLRNTASSTPSSAPTSVGAQKTVPSASKTVEGTSKTPLQQKQEYYNPADPDSTLPKTHRFGEAVSAGDKKYLVRKRFAEGGQEWWEKMELTSGTKDSLETRRRGNWIKIEDPTNDPAVAAKLQQVQGSMPAYQKQAEQADKNYIAKHGTPIKEWQAGEVRAPLSRPLTSTEGKWLKKAQNEARDVRLQAEKYSQRNSMPSSPAEAPKQTAKRSQPINPNFSQRFRMPRNPR